MKSLKRFWNHPWHFAMAMILGLVAMLAAIAVAVFAPTQPKVDVFPGRYESAYQAILDEVGLRCPGVRDLEEIADDRQGMQFGGPTQEGDFFLRLETPDGTKEVITLRQGTDGCMFVSTAEVIVPKITYQFQ